MAFGDPPITNEDIERNLLEHLEKLLPEGLRIHIPGEVFSPERAREWIEPRILSIDFEQESRPGEEFGRLELEVRCFIKTEQKGRRRLELSTLCDKVLEVVGGERNVNAAIILQEDKTDIGRLQFGASRQARLYGAAVSIGGVSIVGLDIATIQVTVLVTGDP